LPPEHELLELFEVEPALRDQRIPWAYNTVTFTTQRGPDEVCCVLEPGFSEMELTWTRESRVVVQLRVGRVEAVRVETDSWGERFVAVFNEKAELLPLIVQLKPFVSVKWGTRT
jgi:hypothetical protein